MLLEYAKDGCHVDVGQPWVKLEIMTVAVQGPHKSALAEEIIAMMHTEVGKKAKDDFAEVVYLD